MPLRVMSDGYFWSQWLCTFHSGLSSHGFDARLRSRTKDCDKGDKYVGIDEIQIRAPFQVHSWAWNQWIPS